MALLPQSCYSVTDTNCSRRDRRRKKTDEKMSEVQAGDEWRLPTIGSCLFFCFGPSVHVQNRPKDSHLVFPIVGFGLKGSKLPQ